ncbi:MAG: 50S ribosomal protein L21 [Gemmatimonadota bacterium]|nr:MAG: 50S ribosomal protein L21 [Gemmatimonadota bacterium]
MYAVIETGGKQFKVTKDDVVRVPKINVEVGANIEFFPMLLSSDEEAVTVGTPHVSKTKVVTSVLGHGKAAKVLVFKMKRRKGYRRTKGHRQEYTELLIQDIVTRK